jgi:hypothetical protein
MISDTPNYMTIDDDDAPWNDPIVDEDDELDDLEPEDKFDDDID